MHLTLVARKRLQIAAIVAVLGFCLVACGREYSAGSITVREPWSRATTPGAAVGAGYMTIVNGGPAPIRLLSASTPVAERVEVHSMTMDGGVMRMRPAIDGLEVTAGGQIELKPSGLHLMLIGLRRALAEGEMVPLKLDLDSGASIDVELRVEAIGGGSHGQ